MDSILKMMNLLLKMMNLLLKMMDFVPKCRRQRIYHAEGVTEAFAGVGTAGI